MAKAPEYKLTPETSKRILVVSEDPWLRFRLQREFERAGCEVVTLAQLRSGDVADPLPYDAVLTDAALLPEGSRLEALRSLRTRSPQARFVLLVGAAQEPVRELAQRSGFELVLQRPPRADGLPAVVEGTLDLLRPHVEVAAVGIPVHFDLLAETRIGRRGARPAVTSLVAHFVVLTLALLFPLMFTESLDPRQFASTWLVAPPPPPPPPPAPISALQARKIRPLLQTVTGRLVAPTSIPKEITRIIDTDEGLDMGGVVGGVPGGVPGGQLGGVIGGVIGGIPSVAARLPLPTPAKPVRVGGNIRPPRVIRRTEPIYPLLARQARVEGDVRIDAIIDAHGRVVEMKVLSGHPLLVKAALEAVQQWLYEPTYLNEQPVPVVLEVTVHFVMR